MKKNIFTTISNQHSQKTYNYRLATYSETKQNRWNRHCPHCGREDFSPYINVHTGEPVDEKVCGKCNHNSSCGYHMPPREWYAKYGSGQKSQRNQYDTSAAAVRQKRMEKFKASAFNAIAARTTYVPFSKQPLHPAVEEYFGRMKALCDESQPGTNVLTEYLYKRFPKERVDEVLRRYQVGNTDDGRAIFWQIDSRGNVRTGKVMAYGSDGHRKKGKGAFTWVHTCEGELVFECIGQCLFGEHLMKDYFDSDSPFKTVAVVESEKTALIMSILVPDVLWLATGGKQNFNSKMLRSLLGEKVLVFPDADAVEGWSMKATEINIQQGGEFVIPQWYKLLCCDYEVRDCKMDLADILLREANAHNKH